MNPLGVSTWVWTSPLGDEDLADLAGRVSAWGFDVLELPVENPGDWDPARAAKVLTDEGLGASVCLVMPPGRDLVAASADTVRATQDYLKHVVDVAEIVGSPVIGGPAYSAVGRTWRMTPQQRLDAYDELRTNLAPVVHHAIEAGVRIAVEPLNRYETSLLNTVDQTMTAIDGLPAAGIGVLLDLYHLNIEERDVPDAIRRTGSATAHVQVCGNDRGSPGRDHHDWPGVMAALADIGYDGALCIESFTGDNDAIATAASIWRPLADTQDELATAGLEFLRGLTS